MAIVDATVLIQGFTNPQPTARKPCAPPMTWKKATLEPLVGKVVRLEFEFLQANLFALHGDWHFIDTQDLWPIEDGKPVPMKRFDNP